MVVFTCAAEALTSTVSVSSPTSNLASTVACCWTVSGNLLLENFLNPAASTVSTYWPGGRARDGESAGFVGHRRLARSSVGIRDGDRRREELKSQTGP